MRPDKREGGNSRERAKSLVSQAVEDEGVMREAREIERNYRDESVGGIDKDISNMGKELERSKDEVVTDGDSHVPSKSKADRIAS